MPRAAVPVAVLAGFAGLALLAPAPASAGHIRCTKLVSESRVQSILGPVRIVAGTRRWECRYEARRRRTVVVTAPALESIARARSSFNRTRKRLRPGRTIRLRGASQAWAYDTRPKGGRGQRGVIVRIGRHVVTMSARRARKGKPLPTASQLRFLAQRAVWGVRQRR